MESIQKNLKILFVKSEEISPEVLYELSQLDCKVSRLKLLTFDYRPFQSDICFSFKSLEKFYGLDLNSVNSGIALKNIKDSIADSLQYISKKLEIFVVGEKTAKFLVDEFQFKITLVAKNYEDLVKKIDVHYNGEAKKLLYLIGTLSDLKQTAITGNWTYEPLTVYQTKEIDYENFENQMEENFSSLGGFPDVLVYFSASNVRFFLNYLQKFEESKNISIKIQEIKHICFGEKTLKEFNEINEKNNLKVSQKNIIVALNSNIKDIPGIIQSIKT